MRGETRRAGGEARGGGEVVTEALPPTDEDGSSGEEGWGGGGAGRGELVLEGTERGASGKWGVARGPLRLAMPLSGVGGELGPGGSLLYRLEGILPTRACICLFQS